MDDSQSRDGRSEEDGNSCLSSEPRLFSRHLCSFVATPTEPSRLSSSTGRFCRFRGHGLLCFSIPATENYLCYGKEVLPNTI